MREIQPSVEIVVNARGVTVLRYKGESLEDEPECRWIHDQIRDLVLEINRRLKQAPH
jgi:hypothetical protein